MLSSVSG